MIETDILYSPLPELTRLLRRKRLTPLRLTEAYLARIEKLSPGLHAFVTTTGELALRQATIAAKEMAAGLYRGPLHGIPYAAKDLFAVGGYPTTWGAVPFASQTFERDAAVITRLGEAGAILLGKTAMSELAGGPPPASATGACRTPWNLTRWSGGSSSGSGAAVAAALAPFALGTETWGSIMTPASFCGVTGFRPSFGRVSRAGAMALCWTMDKVGILGRTAADCATVFSVIGGADPADDTTADAPFKPALSRAHQTVRAMRLGYVREEYERWGEPDVAAAFAQALEVFRELGMAVEEVKLTEHPYETAAMTIIAAEQAAAFEPLVAGGQVGAVIDPDRRGELLGGQKITAVDYLRCQRMRRLMALDIGELFNRVDVILGSSTLQCAPLIDADMASIFAGGNTIEAAENLLGLPGVSVPCGFNRSGLPIGLKFVGRSFADHQPLEAAHLYQSLTDWHTKRPRV